jgi:hypothetical protein
MLLVIEVEKAETTWKTNKRSMFNARQAADPHCPALACKNPSIAKGDPIIA